MIFGEVLLAQAEGAILAHGVPAASLSKGVILGQGHLQALREMGIKTVTIARLEKGDVGEDEAALALAEALVLDAEAQGVRLSKPTAGRVNIIAMRAGLLDFDAAAIDALNAIDPMLTLATLPPQKRVTAGVMLATIKVISYGVQGGVLARAVEALDAPTFQVRTAELTTATLIETHHPGAHSQPKGRRILDERLDRVGCNLSQILDVPHDEVALSNAINNAEGQIVFILTASATSDPHDVAPAAIRRAGGQVTRFGMPVDPGNLLVLGAREDGRVVIALPGCARSPSLNGADWVMERIICGYDVSSADISAMGAGGLLKDTPERGRTRT